MYDFKSVRLQSLNPILSVLPLPGEGEERLKSVGNAEEALIIDLLSGWKTMFVFKIIQ